VTTTKAGSVTFVPVAPPAATVGAVCAAATPAAAATTRGMHASRFMPVTAFAVWTVYGATTVLGRGVMTVVILEASIRGTSSSSAVAFTRAR